jgi:hypothetical protein
VVLGMLIISSLGVLLYRYVQPKDRLIAEVVQENVVIQTMDLGSVEKMQTISIVNNKEHKNVIQIESGKIRFVDADCPDQVCVHAGWLTKPGDVAVCLPNKIYIRVTGEKEDVDSTAY